MKQNHLIDNGSKEIILLGQNVNAYNYEGFTFIKFNFRN